MNFLSIESLFQNKEIETLTYFSLPWLEILLLKSPNLIFDIIKFLPNEIITKIKDYVNGSFMLEQIIRPISNDKVFVTIFVKNIRKILNLTNYLKTSTPIFEIAKIFQNGEPAIFIAGIFDTVDPNINLDISSPIVWICADMSESIKPPNIEITKFNINVTSSEELKRAVINYVDNNFLYGAYKFTLDKDSKIIEYVLSYRRDNQFWIPTFYM